MPETQETKPPIYDPEKDGETVIRELQELSAATEATHQVHLVDYIENARPCPGTPFVQASVYWITEMNAGDILHVNGSRTLSMIFDVTKMPHLDVFNFTMVPNQPHNGIGHEPKFPNPQPAAG